MRHSLALALTAARRDADAGGGGDGAGRGETDRPAWEDGSTRPGGLRSRVHGSRRPRDRTRASPSGRACAGRQATGTGADEAWTYDRSPPGRGVRAWSRRYQPSDARLSTALSAPSSIGCPLSVYFCTNLIGTLYTHLAKQTARGPTAGYPPKREIMRIQHIIVGLALCITAACGGGNSSPTAPTPPPAATPPPAPQIVQVAGVWGYTVTLTGVTGGGCLGAALMPLIGTTSTGTMQVTQQGSSLEAIATLDSDGTATRYTGTAGSSSIALNAVSWDVGSITGLFCLSGEGRDIHLVSEGINGTVNGSTVTGTIAQTANVVESGTGNAAGILTVNSSFVATRR